MCMCLHTSLSGLCYLRSTWVPFGECFFCICCTFDGSPILWPRSDFRRSLDGKLIINSFFRSFDQIMFVRRALVFVSWQNTTYLYLFLFLHQTCKAALWIMARFRGESVDARQSTTRFSQRTRVYRLTSYPVRSDLFFQTCFKLRFFFAVVPTDKSLLCFFLHIGLCTFRKTCSSCGTDRMLLCLLRSSFMRSWAWLATSLWSPSPRVWARSGAMTSR